MKEIYLFTLLFTAINIYIYYYVNNINTCIDYNTKIYIITFYVLSIIYLIYLFNNTSKINKYTQPENIEPIIIDLSSNPEYTTKSSKVIYWGIDFNTNGILDIVDNKVTIPINNSTSIKYRIIDIDENLSEIYSVM